MTEANEPKQQTVVDSVHGIIETFKQDILKAINPLFDNVETMAGHVIVLEEVVKQILKTHPVDKAAITAAITDRIKQGTEGRANPQRTLDTLNELIP